MQINVFGLGKIGTVMSVLYRAKGHAVIGYDPSPAYFKGVLDKSINSGEPGLDELVDALTEKPVHTDDVSQISQSSVSLVIVPTPSDPHGGYDCSYVEAVVRQIALAVKGSSAHLVVVKSTVLPGDLARIRGNVEAEVGHCPPIVYNPEFIALGEVVRNMLNPDLILIGSRNDSEASMVEGLVRSVVANKPAVEKLSIEEAELAKVALNSFITMKIAFANLIGEAAARLGSRQPSRVLEAIGQDRRVGGKYLSPGIGFGGPCFPRDNRALENALERLSLPGYLQKSIDSLNNLVRDAYSENLSQIISSLLQSKPSLTVLILGLSYKSGSPELVESQALELARRTTDIDCVSTYYFDPAVRPDEVARVLPSLIQIISESELFQLKFDVIFLALPILEPERLALCLAEGGILVNPWA